MRKEKYVAFLRGINVGGHHKVPMGELRAEFTKLKFDHVITILNSGNVIFEAKADSFENMEHVIEKRLTAKFGFTIPTIVRKVETIENIYTETPFSNFELTKDTRFYISFLKDDVETDIVLPWISDDNSYQIILKKDKNILSLLDLSVSKTPKAMDILEKKFGKGITTRNWKTIERIKKKL